MCRLTASKGRIPFTMPFSLRSLLSHTLRDTEWPQVALIPIRPCPLSLYRTWAFIILCNCRNTEEYGNGGHRTPLCASLWLPLVVLFLEGRASSSKSRRFLHAPHPLVWKSPSLSRTRIFNRDKIMCNATVRHVLAVQSESSRVFHER